MSATVLTIIRPDHVDAARTMAQSDPDTMAVLLAQIARAARRVGDLDRDDVAQVAALLAPILVTEGHTTSEAASVAVRRACHVMRTDQDPSADSTAPSLDSDDERTVALLRMVTPSSPDPSAQYRTTDADRVAQALDALPSDDDRAMVRGAFDAPWKGGKAPAAAIRRAMGLPAVTGRAGTAWTAYVAETLPVLLGMAQDAAPEVLTLHRQGCEGWETVTRATAPRAMRPTARPEDWTPQAQADADHKALSTESYPAGQRILTRRVTGDAPAPLVVAPTPAAPHVAAFPGAWSQEHAPAAPVVAAVPTTRTPSDARHQDAPASSGPASAVVTWSQRQADRLGVLDGGARRAATAQDRADALALASTLPTSLPAHRTGTERTERDALDLDVTLRRGVRLPGVTVDRDGAAVAPSGVSGRGSGTGTAALRHQAPRKSSRGGGTGPTVPAGPRR